MKLFTKLKEKNILEKVWFWLPAQYGKPKITEEDKLPRVLAGIVWIVVGCLLYILGRLISLVF